MHNINQSGINLNYDLEKRQLDFSMENEFQRWDKKAQEVIFPEKLLKSNHLSLTFVGASVTQSEIHKYIRMFLDSKLGFKEHMQNQNVLKKVSKTKELLVNLQKHLPRPPLKVVSTKILLVCFFSLKESSSETWKNAFYFTS